MTSQERIKKLEEELLSTLPINGRNLCVLCQDGQPRRGDYKDYEGTTHWTGYDSVKCLWHDDYKARRELLGIKKPGT